jgi:hypothetical protein
MVIRVPTKEAKGADIATTEGREKRTNRATCRRGTFLVKISWAISSSWFTKKTKKKKRKATKNETRVSKKILLNMVQDAERLFSIV